MCLDVVFTSVQDLFEYYNFNYVLFNIVLLEIIYVQFLKKLTLFDTLKYVTLLLSYYIFAVVEAAILFEKIF